MANIKGKALTLRCNNHPFGYLMKDLVGCVYCYVLIVVTKIFIIFCHITVFGTNSDFQLSELGVAKLIFFFFFPESEIFFLIKQKKRKKTPFLENFDQLRCLEGFFRSYSVLSKLLEFKELDQTIIPFLLDMRLVIAYAPR